MLKKKSEKASFASLISKAPGAVLIFFIKSYQVFISPLFGQKCKHYPSCSNYSRQAIHKHGVAKGFILTTARLIRCNPWSLGGFDPVPEDISFKQPESFKLTGNYQTQLYKMDES